MTAPLFPPAHKEREMIHHEGRDFERVICWFSHGAASAVATILAFEEYGAENCIAVCQDTRSEHEDNERFRRDFTDVTGIEVEVISSKKYRDIWDVFEKTRWLVGPAGARCTPEMKRLVAEEYLNFFDDLEVLGYTSDEGGRLSRWQKNNEERFIDPILVRKGYDKARCFRHLQSLGIELPAMYLLGYQNNNCIGCVKGQAGYWNKIRRDFPEVFARMAKVERDIGAAICKTEPTVDGVRQRIPVYLDELDPSAGRYKDEPPMSCGFFCGVDE